MTMRDLLLEVAGTYDQKAGTGKGVPGQQVLRGVAGRSDLGPLGNLVVAGYGGNGSAASAPWIGLFDPEINTDPKKGLYLAFIFSTDLSSVTLTVQQGVTDLSDKIKERQAILAQLERRSARLHGSLPPTLGQQWGQRPVLGRGKRPEAYEAASVAARRYEVDAMPVEEQLQEDLRVATSLLQRAAAADAAWRKAADDDDHVSAVLPEQRRRKPSTASSSSPSTTSRSISAPEPVALGFKPRDSSGYIANIAAQQQVKSQKHEELIREFGAYIETRSYMPRNVHIHPKDLILKQGDVLSPGDPEWLVEVKVVRKGDVTAAVREAVGQLREYGYFLYREKQLAAPHLIALFSEDIGAYGPYLEDQGIAAIWQTGDGWAGTPTAAAWGMVD
ncbi:DUF3578 domain-containing protein [Streptomyces sp. BR123]|uniref:MrcB family domain-containing protein n=1 Tax=Streptomyces sp. BR123 TaxID=2749828 RepID=UPI0015C4E2B0|nr:DUF3578 domain-containing protein [Streptomyces sp. BR123]NXY99757.1 DUF3578 domain-containing protein [Streptomyces sp. BR123]